MDYTIKKSLQNDVMTSFWTMLKECEMKAISDDDVVLMKWVEHWYEQWNEVTGSDNRPRWERD